MNRFWPVLMTVTFVLAPVWAQANRLFNQQDVTELGNGVFEVFGRIGDGASDYWCGAGDYAQRVLKAGATERIYVWRPIGPSQTRPGKKSVEFSFRPPANTSTEPGYSLTVKHVGENLTTSSAVQYCYDRVLLDF